MVTRTVICVSASEAAKLAAESSWSSGEADSIIKKASTSIISSDNNNVGGSKRALPSEDIIGGNEINKKRLKKADGFEINLSDVPRQQPITKTKGHIKEGSSKYAGVSPQKSTSKWSTWRAKIQIDGMSRFIGRYENEEEAAVDYARAAFEYGGQEALDKGWEHNSPDYSNSSNARCAGGKKRALPPETSISYMNTFGRMEEGGAKDSISYEEAAMKMKHQRIVAFAMDETPGSKPAIIMDLSDVPPQLPILKSGGQNEEGSSKYSGVYFIKETNKWRARIMIDGQQHHIGYYSPHENEEEAAIDYARAVFKYKGQEALNIAREQISSAPSIDLSDVPPQLPIPKSKGRVKEGASKFTGVTFNKRTKKWQAQITFEGKQRSIGYYDDEEEAAIDYARAVFKYQGQDALDKARERKETALSTNGSDNGIDGGKRCDLPSGISISGRGVKKRHEKADRFVLDLSDVPPQLPIPKKGIIREGTSKYIGVYCTESKNKWKTEINIDRKGHHIGDYGNEEEAAIDYARALFKYHGYARSENEATKPPPARYTNSNADEKRDKWKAHIMFAGKQHQIGLYENDKGATIYHARAAFERWRQEAQDEVGKRKSLHRTILTNATSVAAEESWSSAQASNISISPIALQSMAGDPLSRGNNDEKRGEKKHLISDKKRALPSWGAIISDEEIKKRQKADRFVLDLSDVPQQPLILKSKWFGDSKYTGVSFNKQMNKWHARISIDGEQHHIGVYVNEEEAAADYARAAFKYKGQGALDKARERKSAAMSIDLSDVPPQLPIPVAANDSPASPNTSILRDYPVSQADFHEKQPSFETKSSVRNQAFCDQRITHPTTLSISSDEKFLDPVHIFLRSACIEVFVANDHNPGRGAKPQQLGQVGLRCPYCKHIHKSQRAKQAVSYPSKIINIFESVRNFQRTHFEACTYIPDELKARYKYEKLKCEEHKKIEQKYIKAYYAEAGCEIGLVDTPNGIIFGAPPNLSGKPSQKLLAIMKLAENPAALAHLEELIFPKVKVDQRLQNLKLSHLCTETTRQVIALCRHQKAAFIYPSDFPTISDFRFVLYHQFGPCRPPITALNRRKRCKSRPEKWDTLSGLCCCYCARAHPGRDYHKGMYFPLDLESLNDSSLSHNLKTHLMTCQHTPFEIKEALDELQRLAADIGVKTKRGSRQMFFRKLWERMANYYPAR